MAGEHGRHVRPDGVGACLGGRQVLLSHVEAVQQGRFTFQVRPETRPCTIYVKDVLRAIVDLVHAPAEQLSRRVYNIHGIAPSTGELAEAIAARLPHAQLQFAPDAEIVALVESWPVEITDTSARRDWLWRPRYDLETLADDFIEELKRESTDASGV